jgi:hypothetical protein
MALDPKRGPVGIPGKIPHPPSNAAPKATPPAVKAAVRPSQVAQRPSQSVPVFRPMPVPPPLTENEILAAEELELSRDDSSDTEAKTPADVAANEITKESERVEGGSSAIDAVALRRWRRIVAALAVACLICGIDAWYVIDCRMNDTIRESGNATSSASPRQPAPAVLSVTTAKRESVPNVADNVLRGATVTGCENPGVLIDGNSTDYDSEKGYAHNTWTDSDPNAGMKITMPRLQKISRIRFLLWDKDPRAYGYVVSISADGKVWTTVKDASSSHEQGWQTINFESQNVLAVKIRGANGSANSGFHIVEVEAYDAGKAIPKRSPPTGPIASEAALKPGLCVEYFDRLNHFPTVEDEPTLIRTTNDLCFGAMPPPQAGDGLKNWPLADSCAAIFSGYIQIKKHNLCIFYIESDDGSNLYIDGQLVVPNDGKHTMKSFWGQVELKPGLHRIWIEYFNAGGGMGLNVQYDEGGGEAIPIPATAMFHDPDEIQQTMSPAQEDFLAKR